MNNRLAIAVSIQPAEVVFNILAIAVSIQPAEVVFNIPDSQ
jgi:hypothetical protein